MRKKLLEIIRKLTPKMEINLFLHTASIITFLIYNFNYVGIVLGILFMYFTYVKGFRPAKDKLEHYFWGLIYLVFSYPLYLYLGNLWLLIAFPFIFGLSKEIGDVLGVGNPEELDFLYTIRASILVILSII